MLLDAGPLVLLLSGVLRPDLVGSGKKLSKYNREMFDRLLHETNNAVGHVSLPNILTEASNHLGSGSQQNVPGAANALARYVVSLEEIYQASEFVVQDEVYFRVGLTDAAVISCRGKLVQKRVRVYTEDYELYQRLCAESVDCINIMHWRTPSR